MYLYMCTCVHAFLLLVLPFFVSPLVRLKVLLCVMLAIECYVLAQQERLKETGKLSFTCLCFFMSFVSVWAFLDFRKSALLKRRSPPFSSEANMCMSLLSRRCYLWHFSPRNASPSFQSSRTLVMSVGIHMHVGIYTAAVVYFSVYPCVQFVSLYTD